MKKNWVKIQDRRDLAPAAIPLAFLSLLYGAAVGLRSMANNRKRGQVLPGFVVSIGNLTVGGTGKTPAAVMVAEWAHAAGYRTAILTRGYGGKYKSRILVVSDGEKIKATPEEAGDEPVLLARRLSGIPVIASKKRYLGGLLASREYGTDFFILDDGFQHLALHRDLDLLLLDGGNPFGNKHLLPWGPLREPIPHLRRADAFLITRGGEGYSRRSERLADFIQREFPGKPVLEAMHHPDEIVFPFEERSESIGVLKGKRVIAFAGIGRPEAFQETLRDLAAELVGFRIFSDHHPYSLREIRDLILEKQRLRADYLMTTEKDWIRISGLLRDCPELSYLKISFRLTRGEETLVRMLKDRNV